MKYFEIKTSNFANAQRYIKVYNYFINFLLPSNLNEDSTKCFITGDFIFMTRIPLYIYNAEQVTVNIGAVDYVTKQKVAKDKFFPTYLSSKMQFRYFNKLHLFNFHIRSYGEIKYQQKNANYLGIDSPGQEVKEFFAENMRAGRSTFNDPNPYYYTVFQADYVRRLIFQNMEFYNLNYNNEDLLNPKFPN